MTDFAELVLTAKTEGLKKGETALDQLAAEAERTEDRTDRATDGMGRGFTSMGATIAKAAAGAVVALASFQQASQAIEQARGFQGALAETSTLIAGTAEQMDFLSSTARQMAREFGTNATSQVQAFYSAISGGASSVEEAASTLDAANRLAIGGVTDVSTAVGILNAAMNVYGDTGLTAAQASDALFIAMQAGETTIGELATQLGAVLPFARQVGISFDEVAATTAALTKGGISTAQSVTGIRAALLAVINPTQTALDLAEELGLQFNVAALEAKGFAGFMEDVAAATGGSTEMLAQLFSSSEAGGAAMALAGQAGGFLSENLEAMAQKAGATDIAFEKMAEGLDQRWNRAVSASTDLALGFGNAELTVVVPALEAASGAMELAVENADFLAASLGLLAVTRIPATVAGLTSLVAWLGTAEGLFIAGAVASRGMALAMNAIPFVAAATAATAAYRAFRDNAQAAADYARELVELKNAQDALTDATTRFYDEVTQSNLNAMKTAAEANRQAIIEMIAATKRELESASFKTNFFGASLYETEEMERLRGELSALEEALFDAETQLSAIDHAQENLNSRTAETAETTRDATGSLEALRNAADDLGGSFSRSSDIMREGLGFLTGEIFRLERGMRDIEDAAGGRAIAETVEQAAHLADQLGLTTDQAEAVRSALAGISADDPFADQASALSAVVENLYLATGGAENMNSAALAVYESLLKALNTAIGLSETNYAGGLEPAVTLAKQLAHQFGVAYSFAYSLSTMQVSTKKLSFGGAVPDGSAADGLGVGSGGLSFNPETFVPIVSMEPAGIPPIPSSGGGGSAGGGSGGGLSEAQKEQNDLMEEGKRITEALRSEYEKYTDAVEQADRLLKAGALTQETYNKHVEQLGEEFRDAEFEDVIRGIESVTDAFLDAAFAGENLGDAFRDVLLDMVKNLLASNLKALLTDQLTPEPGAAGGGSLVGSLLGALFGGQKAGGGDVSSGKAYEVGENGREWFVPDVDGTVLPHGKDPFGDASGGAVEIGGGIGVNVSVDDEGKIVAMVTQASLRAERAGRQGAVEDVKRGLSGWQQEIALYGDPS